MPLATPVHLLIIDPQNDFCDISGASLPVPGATDDLRRVAELIGRLGSRLDVIHVTLDSHHPLHIAHPNWWHDEAGLSPSPFTVISLNDLKQGRWSARDPGQHSHSLDYLTRLAEGGRYQLTIWPEHCLIGSWGHNVQADLLDALHIWGREQLKAVDFIAKGSNPGTEHYSAIRAEVIDPNDPGTQTNLTLLKRLAAAGTILIAGEALSHCVAGTVRDIASHLGDDALHKLVLLCDCSHAVPGFEALGQQFLAEMKARGVRLLTHDSIE
ncbi:nicotinamidase-related amidase [Pseudomonas duriflava]|uniref:Nicotinamidase-related amidase n=1 Tax=Pseudomonas duriflava TaxID=459528 RepID=A0A562QBL5_9PSED|nr:hypothetical protein [Pseudomonas duriflava]TWI54147.1 nicotinamidase-related amidase [Pseudomonas duriflava]